MLVEDSSNSITMISSMCKDSKVCANKLILMLSSLGNKTYLIKIFMCT
jgi:hypothetical protein